MVWFVDTTVETRPMVVSSYTAPEAERQFLSAWRPVRRAFLE